MVTARMITEPMTMYWTSFLAPARFRPLRIKMCIRDSIKGKTIEEALAVTNKQVVDALGGLPAYKLHCSVLAEESIKAAVKNYYDRNNIPYDHSKFPDCEHCEGGCAMV